MNAPMSEGQSGEATLEGIDGPTFARFCHWVYANSYPAAEVFGRSKDVALTKQSGRLCVHGNLYTLAHACHGGIYLDNT